MAYEQRDNSGSLFIEENKQSEKHPDYKGKAMIGGKLYYVSGWKKKSGSGKVFLSLAFEAPRSARRDADEF